MIAILITTMLRDNLLFSCLESIQRYNNNFYVVVVDQGYQTIEKADFMLKYFSNIKGEYIRTDFDIGALKARNIGIQRIKELNIPYTLMFADSIKFLQSYNFNPIIEFLESSNNHFLCGFNLKNSICTWECDMEKTDRFELDIPKRLPITYKCLNFQPVDLCRNIFLCKTELLYNSQYDEDRKLGDHESVKGDTPVIFKNRHGICILPIKNLMKTEEPPRKDICLQKNNLKNYHIWTDNGWSQIKYIKRHPCTKKMYRIVTSQGYIECTDDHSLIINNEIIQPKNLKVGDSLELIGYPKLSNSLKYNNDLAWLLGFFLADGSYYLNKKSENNIRPVVSFSNTKIELLNKCQKILQTIGVNSKITQLKICYNGSYNKKSIFRLQIYGQNHDIAVNLFSKFYYKKTKLIPSFVYDFTKNNRVNFLNGFIEGDGHKCKERINTSKISKGEFKISQKSESIVQGILFLAQDIWNWSLNFEHHNNSVYIKLRINKTQKRKANPNIIKKIELYDYEGFVYDIETENHHFCGGIGNVNLHNSSFYRFQQKGYKCFYVDSYLFDYKRDRPLEYSKFRDRFGAEKKKMMEKYHLKGWVSYSNALQTKWKKEKLDK